MSPDVVSDPTSRDSTLRFEEPAWKKITPANGPAAREDHTWTVDADGRFAYLFGGRDGGKDFGDLWRFDLQNDTWKKLSPGGKRQSRVSATAPSGSTAWAWWSSPARGASTSSVTCGPSIPTGASGRSYPANGAAPKRRYGSCMIVGRDGRLWISHGFTFAGRFDDTRAYNLKTSAGPASRPTAAGPASVACTTASRAPPASWCSTAARTTPTARSATSG